MIVPKVSQVIIFQLKEELTKEPVEYKTRVADENEQVLVIELPINTKNGRMKRLQAGDVLSASFITNTGVKHFFETYVTKVREAAEGELIFYEIARPSEDAMTSVQRRNFFRIDIEVDIAVKNKQGQRFVFKTDDIGGGGVSFMINRNQSFEPGEKLSCWLLLPHRNGTIEHSCFEAEVLREKELETGRKIIMVKFDEIAEQERQRVIRFLFEKQIQFRDR
ncbi:MULTISPECIES: flagellar brake protein [Paenibacillus]|uniref:flagellar brake protein n=1 Tax=Paenibacillus TaxID=44249 RepID=UPI00203B5C8A|nr:PilZ domain-containing protein [Paenibacillus camelliae]